MKALKIRRALFNAKEEALREPKFSGIFGRLPDGKYCFLHQCSPLVTETDSRRAGRWER